MTPPIARLLADPRLAVTENTIVCLICCGVFRQLTNTHLRAHGTTAAAYKLRFGYNAGRPLMCEALARHYAERAVRVGLAARIARRLIVIDPSLRRRGGRRPITLEESLNRRDAQRRARALDGTDGMKLSIPH
jgi:hypothetical protein